MRTPFSNLHRRARLRNVASTIGACSLPLPALAQTWPSKSVRLVVPYAAGNLADSVARLLAEQLGKKWSQPLVVDNQPGAGGAIGVAQLARAAPDGPGSDPLNIDMDTAADRVRAEHTLFDGLAKQLGLQAR